MFWFFGHEACEMLAPWTGIEPALPALEDEGLINGPPGKSLIIVFSNNINSIGNYGNKNFLMLWLIFNDENMSL